MRLWDRGSHTRARGASAEDRAAAWLTERGYEVLERNVTTPAGEIDAVARDGEYLCFIEIKARAVDTHGSSLAAVDARKQRRLVRAARYYLAALGDDERACRFDVLGMDREDGRWRFTLIRDAFGEG